jgi:hypothetical protein
MKSSRCPKDFEPNETSTIFCQKFGMTKDAIDDALFAMKDHEYKQPKSDWDATFRNWIRTAIKYGDITPVQEHKYNMPEEIGQETRKADIIAFNRQMKRFGK